MASPEHEGLVMQLIYDFIIPNGGVRVNPPIDIALQSYHYDPSNVGTKIGADIAICPHSTLVQAPLNPGPPSGDVKLNPHARVIVEVAVTEDLDFLNRKCENWLLQQYVRSVFGIKIYDKRKGTNHRTMRAKLWTRQIPAPVRSRPSTLAGVSVLEWDFGTLRFNSNQPTGCTGAGLPNYTVTIPVSDVFWDPPS
ncbi:hypothetical protein C1645_810284 [Glomus cerebriforme]|uniref:Restriction endonuclease domain-containing protein n=1 Tax=Glomus cerebriforme TaxID=658196 RepID=A0A397S4D0_9GLOM|nr:hypothetical protein C1645_810284 [Glomus cerebriforme]